MLIPESWLRTLANPSMTTAELAHLLTMSGLEVESCTPVAPPFTGIVVGEVLTVAKHPNADKLSLCSVNAGQGEPLQIVCGAPNVRAGMKVPLAMIGASLPGLEIKAAKMRGVESQGMLCSARELGMSEDHSGLLELDAAAVVGGNVRDLLQLDDHVFEIKLTPNKADCLSVLGVAREVAALTRAKLLPPDVKPVAAKSDAKVAFGITDADGCGRFTGRAIRNVNAKAPTPDWMKQRLERAGQRSISALVDVTNYVMLELGRPLHVYDQDKLSGAIDVRWGRAGEKLKLLNEQTVDVDANVLCIADGSGPIGLAGIMGGDSTKAELETTNIFLESAFFFPAAIAGRSRRYNFSSDASHRFERGVDFDNNIAGIERATQLVLDICGGEPGPTVDLVSRLPERKPVAMRIDRARKIIGVPVSADEMADIFTRLSLPFTRSDDAFTVTPPSYRFDIEIEEDLIEEIARVYGFERIPANPPSAPAAMRTEPEGRRSLHALRALLAGRDYQEVVNFSFVDAGWEADLAGNPDPIKLLNPIASHQSVMRSTLLGGLIETIRYNAARKLSRIRVFEVGRAFLRDASVKEGDLAVAGLHQPMRIAAAAFGPADEEQWGIPVRGVDFFDLKADVEAMVWPRAARFEAATHPALHPGRSARVWVDGEALGWIGELHPRWQARFELPQPVVVFELDATLLQAVPVPHPGQPSRFPSVVRDLAVLVDAERPVQALLDALSAEKPAIVRSVRLFDLYHGKNLPAGRKSLAFRIVMQDTEKTLTDAEADSAIAQMIELLGQRFGATLRS
ncbi:MAG: phenylalanine--tRNA ligase subunit beta [Betaproteobacteria bacterium]|nr:phenylalanine--tRNA ligase subunit beta [Betaproteobacteria bacterium]